LNKIQPDWWGLLGSVVILSAFLGAGWFVRGRSAPIEVGSRAPDFIAVDLDGHRVSLSDLKGEVVFLNIWATWCPPCRAEMPSMQRLYEELGPAGLRIVAVSVDTRPARVGSGAAGGGMVREFIEDRDLTFDIWLDPSGDIQRVYQTSGVPESLIIDRDGSIRKKVIGATTWDTEASVAFIRALLGD
jgi:cytochrome c biogenesis protein CcmG/thiol:disulfide interchange protein DsbE